VETASAVPAEVKVGWDRGVMETPMIYEFAGYGTTAQLVLRGIHIGLEPALGGAMLTVRAEAAHEGLHEGVPVLFTGAVRIAVGRRPLLGTIQQGERNGPLILRSVPAAIELCVPLSYEAMDAVEDLRDGGDLEFALRLHATLARPLVGPAAAALDHSAELGKLGGGAEWWPTVSRQGSVHVTSGDWVRQLEQIETAASFLIVSRAPRGDGRRTEATAILRQAQKMLGAGLVQQAVAEARKVLDVLAEIGPPGKDPRSIDPRDRTLPERWAALWWAVKGLANPAPHADELAAQMTWTRDEAVLVLGAIAGLLQRTSDTSAPPAEDVR
jgi:hypothetical protein